MKRDGFSLVELSVVLLLMGIAAGAVALRVEGPIRRAKMETLVTRIEAFDCLTRTQARELDRPLRTVIDAATGELRRTTVDGRDAGVPLVLPEGFGIGRLWLADQEFFSGSVAVSCSRQGLMPTYALLIEGPGGRRTWLLVAGLSGRVTELDDEQAVQNIMDALRQGDDAR